MGEARLARFQIDHIIPQSIDRSKTCLYDNLLYVCDSCNVFKSNKVLPDPCTFDYGLHYKFEDDGTAAALTDSGELYIEILGLNVPYLVEFRRAVVTSLREFEIAAEEIGDVDLEVELEDYFGYPSDIPDIHSLKPKQNFRPGSECDCYYSRLMNDEIPRIY